MLDDKKRLENALVSSAMAKAGDGMLREKAQRWVLYSGIRTFHQILQGEFTLITDQNHLVKTPEGIEQPAAGRFQRWTLVESHCLAWGGLWTPRSWDLPLSATAGWQCSQSLHFKVLFLQKKLHELSWQIFIFIFFSEEICTGGMESSWRAVSPRGKHFWCLVSNLLEKNRCQCQLQSVSMQKLASAPVPARDRKLRPGGIHRGLSMEFWISPF